jgi:AraC-like DNA-binding protein
LLPIIQQMYGRASEQGGLLMYTVETLRTGAASTRERGDWWRDRVSAIHCPMSFSLDRDYRGKIEHQRSDAYQLVRWWGDGETVTRRKSQIRRHPHGSYELVLPLHGPMLLRQDDISAEVHPGTMVLTSLDSTLDLRHGDSFSSIAFVIPRARLDSRTAAPLRPGTVLDGSRGLGRIVIDQIRSLRRERAAVTGCDFDVVADRIVDLLAIACNGVRAVGPAPVHDGLAESIRMFIRVNAHDPELTGTVVAARLGWSLRHVQAQLQRSGTTASDLIRQERLALARLRLQDPGWRHQSITQIAYSSGFADLSTFSNSYRLRFGERPSQTRAG